MSERQRRWWVTALAACVVAPAAAAITGPATAATTLHGLREVAAPGLDRAQRVGEVDRAVPMRIELSLALRNRDQLQRYIATISDPRSSHYGERLDPATFAARFGPSDASLGAVAGYLRTAGISVDGVSPARTLVSAHGSTAAVERALNTALGRYRDRRSGAVFRANDAPPSLPSALATQVVDVAGLDDRAVLHDHVRLAHPRQPPGHGAQVGGLAPADIQQAYGIAPLVAQGIQGQGRSLGLLELAMFNQSNIATYDSTYSLPVAAAPVVHSVDGGALPMPGGEAEAELDIELMQAVAPAASIQVWEAPNSDLGVIDAYNAMVTSNSTEANSTSWGGCEFQQVSAATIQALHNIFMQAAAQGQTFTAASGDAGAYDCEPPASPPSPGAQLAVDNPADDPFVTGVGGTTLGINGDSGYAGESGWRYSGGGLSGVFGRPDYQTRRDAVRGGSRQVPDVALDADPGTGYSVYVTDTATLPPTTGFTVAGGTSAGSPIWAAYVALLDQLRRAGGRPSVGFANPLLYALRGCSMQGAFFHDITLGSNEFWSAGPGYDMTTGLGTITGATLPPAVPIGYRLTASDGGVFSFGSSPFDGSTGALHLNQPIVAAATGVGDCGYWLVASDGGIFSFGNAAFRGSTGALRLNRPIVGMAVTSDGGGYWLVASDGGIFSFGNAAFRGSTGAMRLNRPIVGMAATPDGGGYWLVASDGGIFSFGNAAFHGSTGAMRLNRPIVAMAATPDGGGYWLAASDGGIFSFGDAPFLGSTGAMRLNQPVVGMSATPDGGGYWLVASDGGIFSFGGAPFLGSTGAIRLNRAIVAMAGR
jgi:kumamolisin